MECDCDNNYTEQEEEEAGMDCMNFQQMLTAVNYKECPTCFEMLRTRWEELNN